MDKGAILSECEKYRFQLWRIWDRSKPFVLFIMHNPSTADADNDDPTIRRCIGFAKSFGYGGIYIGNLCPYRATNPKDIPDNSNSIPLENIRYTNEMVSLCELHILAYGNPIYEWMKPELIDDRWHALKLTKSGNPCHPLYLKSDLIPFKIEQVNQNKI